MTQTVSLCPFQDQNFQSKNWENIQLTSKIQRSQTDLELHYQLEGDFSKLQWPERASKPSRQDNLWETTCLEFFISPKESSIYYEINLSPSGHWNIYRFDHYRSGMREAVEIQALPYESTSTQTHATVSCHFPLSPLHLISAPLDLSLTAVLALKSGDISYWATQHTADQPDFHQRNSFIIQI